eukprot:TRINITY_DN28352_c0_g1_i1.p1 TRINITY_DN28352_c0_g1~~TRINITY_DN28352_c0_g1_i1.p1  ORF type:complete len:140 (-),score=35.86 TRINITY_DN28352_c0_g1_i1:103-522(-)
MSRLDSALSRTDSTLDALDDLFPNKLRFDKAAFKEITEGDAEMEYDMLDTYFESTKEELEKLKSAMATKHAAHLEIYAHSIKGAAKYVGAAKVAERALQIETLSKQNQLGLLPALISGLEIELLKTNEILQEYKGTISL